MPRLVVELLSSPRDGDTHFDRPLAYSVEPTEMLHRIPLHEVSHSALETSGEVGASPAKLVAKYTREDTIERDGVRYVRERFGHGCQLLGARLAISEPAGPLRWKVTTATWRSSRGSHTALASRAAFTRSRSGCGDRHRPLADEDLRSALRPTGRSTRPTRSTSTRRQCSLISEQPHQVLFHGVGEIRPRCHREHDAIRGHRPQQDAIDALELLHVHH